MDKPKRGRPQVWPSKIVAPPLAIELYQLIGKLQKSDDFETCHIYKGARLNGEPMIKFNGKSTGLAFVVASYMGLPSSTQKCDTPGCCNPFHYLPNGTDGGRLIEGNESKEVIGVHDISVEEWSDLIDYEIDRRAMKREDVNFDSVRAIVMVEDLSDEQLKAGLQHYLST